MRPLEMTMNRREIVRLERPQSLNASATLAKAVAREGLGRLRG